MTIEHCPRCGQVHSVIVTCPPPPIDPAVVMGAAGPIGRIDPIGPYGRVALQTARETFGLPASTTCAKCSKRLSANAGLVGLCETCDPGSFTNTAKAYEERRAREVAERDPTPMERRLAVDLWERAVTAVESDDGNPDALLATIVGLVHTWQTRNVAGGALNPCAAAAVDRCPVVTPWDDPPINPRRQCALPVGHSGSHSLIPPSRQWGNDQ